MISVSTRKDIGRICSPALVRRRAQRILKLVGFGGAQLSILLTGDEEIRDLNRTYRGFDKPTDVLSFPQFIDTPVSEIPRDGVLGDVIISIETAARQADGGALPRIRKVLQSHGRQMTWSVEHEVSFLLLHGVLHLLGFDHLDDGDACVMEQLEARLCPLLFARSRASLSIDFD